MPEPPRGGDIVSINQFSITETLPGTGQPGIHERGPVILNHNQNTEAGSWTTKRTHPDHIWQVAKYKMVAAGLQKPLSSAIKLITREACLYRLQNVVGSSSPSTALHRAPDCQEICSFENYKTSLRC